jgi:hypothetical protein
MPQRIDVMETSHSSLDLSELHESQTNASDDSTQVGSDLDDLTSESDEEFKEFEETKSQVSAELASLCVRWRKIFWKRNGHCRYQWGRCGSIFQLKDTCCSLCRSLYCAFQETPSNKLEVNWNDPDIFEIRVDWNRVIRLFLLDGK